eukprot:86651-Prorocentrum_minimum.AAC.1
MKLEEERESALLAAEQATARLDAQETGGKRRQAGDESPKSELDDFDIAVAAAEKMTLSDQQDQQLQWAQEQVEQAQKQSLSFIAYVGEAFAGGEGDLEDRPPGGYY